MRKTPTILFALAMFVALLAPSCQKTEVEEDPCAGLIGDVSPISLYVKFVDKETGEDLIVANGLDREDINITIGQTGEPFELWSIYHHETPSPLNGAIQLTIIPHTEEGDYRYIIQAGDLVTATFSTTVDKVENDGPCGGRYYYPISAIEITDHPFEPLEYEGNTYPGVLVVAL